MVAVFRLRWNKNLGRTQLNCGVAVHLVLSVMARLDIGILFINLIRLLLNARLEEFTMTNSYRISNMIHF